MNMMLRMFPEDQQLIEELLRSLSLVLMCVTSDACGATIPKWR